MPITRKNVKSGSWRPTSGVRKTTNKRNTRTNTTSGNWTPSAAYSPTKFKNCHQEVVAKIGSFRTINQQFTGAGKVTAFSPTTANKWIKYVNTGCRVYKFNNNEFSRYFGKYFGTTGAVTGAPTTALKKLQKQFGAGIKAITRGKGSNWLIAATPNVNGHPFNNYNWK